MIHAAAGGGGYGMSRGVGEHRRGLLVAQSEVTATKNAPRKMERVSSWMARVRIQLFRSRDCGKDVPSR